MSRYRGTKNADIIQKASALGVETSWERLLSVAIFVRAILDTKTLDRKMVSTDIIDGVPVSRDELRSFYNSGWCDSLIMGIDTPVDAVLSGCGIGIN